MVLGKRYRPAIVDAVLDESDHYPASHSTFSPFDEIEINWRAHFPASEAVDRNSAGQGPASADSLSLKFIDSDLYRAILRNPELMRSVDWRTFERLLAQILEDFGYEIELQRGTKDGGVDVFALRKNGAFGTEKYLVQAKRWNAAVGVSPVRELAFLHDEYGMTKSCLATTATFTKGAWQLADLHRWRLSLRDFEGLQEWVKGADEIRRSGCFVKSGTGLYIPR